MKITKSIIAFLMSAALVTGCLTSCSDGGGSSSPVEPEVNYTVTYVTPYGTAPEEQTVLSGTSINLAAAISQIEEPGVIHTFSKWNDGTKDYSAGASYKVTADTTMTAVWTDTAILDTTKTVSSISIKTLPSKVRYTTGASAKWDGLVVTVNYSDSTSADISRISDFTITGFDSSVGTESQTITVTVGSATDTFTISVYDSPVDEDGNVKDYNDSSLSEATLWVVGDSTVCDYMKDDGTHTDATYFYPRYGYGTQLANNLSSKITVKNLALSGRSSKSFLAEANYSTLVSGIKAGDFLVIGFGHNDQKSDDADRFASASQSTDTEGSFKNILYNKYVKIAQDKGATPVLCSPIVRISMTDDYSGANAHVTSAGDYRKAVEELAEEKSVQFVDLTTETKNIYAELGHDEAVYFHAMSQGSSATEPNLKSYDGTHINIFGAKMVSYFFANTILGSSCALKPYVKSTYKPTKADDLVKNPSFVYVEYEAPDLSTLNSVSHLKCITSGWYGTGFGDCGGVPSAGSNGFYAQETSTGVFKVGQTGTTSPKGKITSTADGFAFAFQQLPVSKNFTLTAKAKVLAVAAETKQAGFGLMLRDDCYTPNKIAVSSNYVAAGLYADSTSSCVVNWKRETGTQGLSTNKISALYSADDTAELSIERVGQVVKVKTVYKSTTYENTYTDFDFVAKDSDYFYAGMFGTRGTCVEFTNVVLTITGESQGA